MVAGVSFLQRGHLWTFISRSVQLPDEIFIYIGLVGASEPALYLDLKRYDYPCRMEIWFFTFQPDS